MPRAMALMCLLVLAACASDSRDPEPFFRVSDDSGSLQVMLLGADGTGASYRLKNATFEVSGSAMVTLSSASGAAAVNSLSTPLPTGDYQVYLRPGFEIVELGAGGDEHPVAARLSSPNPARVYVLSRSDGQIELSFRHGDADITFGSSPKVRMGERATAKAVLARAPALGSRAEPRASTRP